MVREIRELHLSPQILGDTLLDDAVKFTMIMSPNETNDTKQTAKFIYEAFEDREIKLDVLNTIDDLVTSTVNLLSESQPDPADDIQNLGQNHGSKTVKKHDIYQVKNHCLDSLKITLCRIR